MAHVDQARKSTLMAAAKAALAKWPGVKWTLSVRNHSTIVMTIAQGDIDFEADAILSDLRGETTRLRDGHVQVNHHHSMTREWRGEALAFLTAAREALHMGNHDRSDIQSDYVDVGWYVEINVGRWNKPYVCTAAKAAPAPAVEAAASEPEPQACPVCESTEDHTGIVCIRRTDREPARMLVERANEVAAEMAPQLAAVLEPPAVVRANSLLSPIQLIGAEQHEADYIGACIGNLTEPVRRGHITIREALERVAKAAFQTGFTAGDRWARESR